MKKFMKSPLKRVAAMLVALIMILSPLTDVGVLKAQAAELAITDGKGYEEGAYAKWNAVEGADSYKAYVSSDGSTYTEINSAMIRKSGDTNTYRVDEVGLAAGTYTIKVEALAGGSVIATKTTESLTVTNYDRSGYAHYKYTEGVGAYNDNGTLKDNAIVLYVTDANKDTVSVTSKDGTTVTGIGHILNSAGRDVGNGKTSNDGKSNNNSEIIRKLADDGRPLVVRIIGRVTAPEGVTAYDSPDYGGSVGDNGFMARIQSGKDITIEGIGSDAVIDGWGIHFIAQSSHANYGESFEVRNISFYNVPEDCVGMEGQQEGTSLTVPVERCWIHNCAFYAPKIEPSAEKDKAGGDGACDFKRGQYFTNSYCYYYGYHKTNLVGGKDENLQYHLTYHHNYWKNCESRGPLARQANIHMYNNIFEGQSSYCMNPRANAYIFSEYNIFINSKDPVRVVLGAVKSYRDSFTGCTGANDATIVTDKSTKVNTECKYANFDTDASISYIPSGNYQLQEDLTEVKKVVTAYAGSMPETPVSPDEVPTSVVAGERVPAEAVVLPYSKTLNSTYVTEKNTTVDNIVFNVNKTAGDCLVLGGNATGQDIVFKVNTAVNITMTEVAGDYAPILCNEAGIAVLTGGGTVTNLPAGVYFIQSGGYDNGSAKYKEAKVSSLKIEAYDPDAPIAQEYTITVQNDGNGTARANVAKATEGSTVTLFATPGEGYTFDSWQVVEGGVTISSDKFVMPEKNVTVKALFKQSSSTGDTPSGDTGDNHGTGDGGDKTGTVDGGDKIGTGHVHNFTTSGKESKYYTIVGNLSKSKGEVNYNGLKLTQCLKMESSTSITFNAEAAGTLILVFNEGETRKVKIDGTKYAATDGEVKQDLTSGSHVIQKGDSMNLYYMEFIPQGSGSGGGDTPGGDTSGGDIPGGGSNVAVTGVTLDQSTATLTTKNATTTLTATVAPANATNKKVSWTSSNTSVATVKDGVVTALANGSTIITATTEDGGKTATCLVTVAISVAGGGEVDDHITITESKGYQEGAYVEWKPVLGAIGYKAYVAASGGTFELLDDKLIRQYPDCWRVDAVGLSAGTYDIKVEAVMSDNSSLVETASGLKVIAYERTGYAWVDGTSSGAYNEDGTLKSKATVIYVTENNKADIMTELAKYADGNYPLCIRIIGNITPASNFDAGDVCVDDKKATSGLTIEGIGEDATANGWGIRIKNSTNVEIRNLGFMNCASDEGDSVGLQQDNAHIWVHDNDFFYGAPGSDKDQAKGDGALDSKKSTYVTHSYNHFWDTGKTNLNGNKETTLNYLTYHHNWYDHSDSRHPLVRVSSAVHVYNNLYDGISKYGMIARMGSSIFAESNYFKDTKNPMLISQQGTDIASGDPIASDDGGMIKAYGNTYDNTTAPITHKDSATSFDCYEAATRDEAVPDTYKALKGGSTYSNFDTDGFYSYTAETAADAKTTVETYAGRVNGGDFTWNFSDPKEDTNYGVIEELRKALQDYIPGVVVVGGMKGEIIELGQGGGVTPGKTYTVTFNTMGGSSVDAQRVMAGKMCRKPADPSKDGYTFAGWYTDESCTTAYDFDTAVNADIELYAKWTEATSGGGSTGDGDSTGGGSGSTGDGGDSTGGGSGSTGDGGDSTGDGGDSTGDGNDKQWDGLHVELVDPGEEYVYTGSAIKPAIIVTNNGEELVAGVDYTVRYRNNIKASTDKKKATITVKGKGNLTGSNSTTFTILPKDINDDDVKVGSVVVAKNSKAAPVLVYRHKKLGTKDYTVADAKKKFVEDGEITVTGKGNFKGELKIAVKVVDKKDLKKFTVKVEKSAFVYDGQEHKPTVTVADKTTKAPLTEGVDYEIVYGNTVNAGTVKLTVIGMGMYTGSVVKSYKIKPLVVKDNMEVTGVDKEGYPYSVKGVTIGDDLTVTYKTTGEILTEGRDYKVTYSANKKVGTAKYKVTFLGNYKGSKALKGEFSIVPEVLSDATADLKIAVADQIYKKKPNIYKSVPVVTVGGVALKKSDYTVSYFTDSEMKNAVGKNNKVTVGADDAYATVYVKVVGKGNYGADSSAYATAEYKVWNSKNVKNLSKARVTFVDASGTKLKKLEYTGKELEPAVKVEYKDGKTWVTVPADQYEVTYANNVNKGKATVIVTGTGSEYAGSKTAKFSIVARNLKTLSDLLKDLFGI